VAAWSRDGGRSFSRSVWPVSRCAGGLDYERASDPWVSIGPEGVVYGSGLVFDADTPRNGVAATTSYDGGRTWRNTTTLIADTDPRFIDDKNSVTADPVRPGTAYQVWDRLVVPPDNPNQLVTGPTWMSVTHDFGRTWSAPQVIVQTGQFEQTIGNVMVIDRRTGTLYVVFTAYQFTDVTSTTVSSIRYEIVRSRDGGRTWSTPSLVVPDTSVADVDPNDPSKVLRTGAGLPEPAIDPRTGTLYVAYEGSDFTGGAYNQVQLVRSDDGGVTWSGPVRVNGDPATPAVTPMVAVNEHGDVGVTYYDFRTLRSGDTTTLPTSTWLTVSARGGTHFARERQLAPVFDMLQAPFAGGYFVGDYEGLAAFDDTFRALFVTTNTGEPNNRTDVYFASVRSFEGSRAVAPAAGAAARAATAAPSLRPALRSRR
jgi:hypothetical protein